MAGAGAGAGAQPEPAPPRGGVLAEIIHAEASKAITSAVLEAAGKQARAVAVPALVDAGAGPAARAVRDDAAAAIAEGLAAAVPAAAAPALAEALERQLPPVLRASVTRALTHLLTRAVTHTLTQALPPILGARSPGGLRGMDGVSGGDAESGMQPMRGVPGDVRGNSRRSAWLAAEAASDTMARLAVGEVPVGAEGEGNGDQGSQGG